MKRLKVFILLVSAGLVLAACGGSQKGGEVDDDATELEITDGDDDEQEDNLAFVYPSTPEGVVRAALDAMIIHDLERAAMFQAGGESSMSKLKEFDSMAGLVDYEIGETKITGDKATVKVVMKTAKVGNINDRAKLIRTADGEWKMK